MALGTGAGAYLEWAREREVPAREVVGLVVVGLLGRVRRRRRADGGGDFEGDLVGREVLDAGVVGGVKVLEEGVV